MALVPAKCTQCGANLKVDPKQEAAVCPFCHTPFITEEVINNYNTTYVTNIGNLHADKVVLQDQRSKDNQVKAGETFLKLGDYERAKKVFYTLTDEYPDDRRGWIGLIAARSNNYSDISIGNDELSISKYYYQNACAVTKPNEPRSGEAEAKAYFKKVEAEIKARFEKAEAEKRALYAKRQTLRKKIKDLERKRKCIEDEYSARKREINTDSRGLKGILPIATFALACIVNLRVGTFAFWAISVFVMFIVGCVLDYAVVKIEKEEFESLHNIYTETHESINTDIEKNKEELRKLFDNGSKFWDYLDSDKL